MILEINTFNKPIFVELDEDEIISMVLEDGTDAMPILDRMNRLYKEDCYEALNNDIVIERKNYTEFIEEQRGLI